MADWLFLSYSNPEEAKTGKTRKKIRAHVTSRQHALNRQATEEKSSIGSKQSEDHDDSTSRSSSSTRSFSTRSSSVRASAVRSSSNRPKPKNATSVVRAKRRVDVERHTVKPHVSCWNPQADHDAANAANTRSGAAAQFGRDDPYAVAATPPPTGINLNITPVPRKEWYDWLHDYWFAGTLPKAETRLKINTAQLRSYIAWTRRLLVTEPAMYYMSLLLATGIPVSNGEFPLYKALWLRGQTITALNEALADPERATSDAMIQAVGYVALHEHIYGDRAAAHQLHRPVQQHMIQMRGGINNLGLPSEVKQVMVWYDRLMAAEAGNEPYFKSLADGISIKDYSNDEAMSVTNNASPLRKRHPGYSMPAEYENAIDD